MLQDNSLGLHVLVIQDNIGCVAKEAVEAYQINFPLNI